MTRYEIQPATLTDASVIAAFNVALAAESEHLALDPPTVEAGVTAVLRDAAKGRYFVARSVDTAAGNAPDDAAGLVVGQILITYEWSDWRNGQMWWVQSVYVDPDHRRRGIFRALLEHVLEAAAAAGVAIVRLYVEQNNSPARATYTSLGLKDAGYLVMERSLSPPTNRMN